MKKIFYLLFIFYCLLSTIDCSAQQFKIDSLLTLLKTDISDTNKLLHLNRLGIEYKEIGNYDSAMFYSNSAQALVADLQKSTTDLNVKKAIKKGEAGSYNNIGNIYNHQGNYPEALKNHFLSLEISLGIDDKKGIAASHHNIGNVFYVQGNYAEALRNYFSSLKTREGIHDQKGIAAAYSNIGLVYYLQGNYPAALKNHLASLEIYKKAGYKKGIAYSYNNIGIVQYAQGNYPEALKNDFASLEIREALGDKSGISTSYGSIGFVYFAQGEREKDPELRKVKLGQALENFSASLKLREALGDKAGIAAAYNSIGSVLKKQKKYSSAAGYFTKAKKLSEEIGYKEGIRDSYGDLAYLDSATGDFKGAYQNHKLYILYRDSLDNEESRKKTIQSQMTYDFEKKEAVASVEHKKELENQQVLAEEKSRKQKMVLLFVVSGLLLVVIFAGFVFRSLRVTRKQKNIIERQKKVVEQQKLEVEQQKVLVEEHQKSIIDSITYARRIQRSQLPTEKYIDRTLKRLMKYNIQ